MTLRTVVLKIHLYLGLVGAIFLAILGLTGTVMAFEADISHWLHPELWYVTPGPQRMPENDLISIVNHNFPRAHVTLVQFFRAANLVQVMQLSDGTSVYINPYDGSILGNTVGLQNSDLALGYIHQLHLRLAPDPRLTPRLAIWGKIVMSYVGLVLCFMVPSGLYLWWRRKSTSVNWKGTWFRVSYDLHQVIGVYVAIFLFISAFTGTLIGFGFGENMFYAVTRSSPPARPQLFVSTPIPKTDPIMADQALEIARNAIPNATPAMMVRPIRSISPYIIFLRLPEETSEAVHSTVTIDQYSGKVLNVRNYRTESTGYRWIRFNRSIHTGDIFGLPSHIIVSLSSFLLVVMVFTGVVTWWKKLA